MRGILLDRDGVINRQRHDYIKNWAELELLPGVLDALVRLARTESPILVITNQACISHGLVTSDTIDEIHQRLARTSLARAVGSIDSTSARHPPAAQLRLPQTRPRPTAISGASARPDAEPQVLHPVQCPHRSSSGPCGGCRPILVKFGSRSPGGELTGETPSSHSLTTSPRPSTGFSASGPDLVRPNPGARRRPDRLGRIDEEIDRQVLALNKKARPARSGPAWKSKTVRSAADLRGAERGLGAAAAATSTTAQSRLDLVASDLVIRLEPLFALVLAQDASRFHAALESAEQLLEALAVPQDYLHAHSSVLSGCRAAAVNYIAATSAHKNPWPTQTDQCA